MFGVKVQTDAGDPIALNKPPVSLNKMQVWTWNKGTVVAAQNKKQVPTYAKCYTILSKVWLAMNLQATNNRESCKAMLADIKRGPWGKKYENTNIIVLQV